MNYKVTLLLYRIFMLLLISSLLCSDLQTIQHITVKYTLEDSNFHRVIFSKQLGI